MRAGDALVFHGEINITLHQIEPTNVGERFNITILPLSVSEITTKLRILLNPNSWLPGNLDMIRTGSTLEY